MNDNRHKEKDVHALPIQEKTPIPRDELEKTFREHSARILNAAFRITGSSDDAEDVLQTVFLRLLKRKDTPDLSTNPGAYMHRAAVNAALDIVRSRSAARSQSIDDLAPRLPDEKIPSPDRQLASQEIKSRLRGALAQLNASTAEIFALRYFEGYSNQEIARMTDCSQGSIGVTLHRARHRIQQELTSSQGETS